jgi:hypothetical protein
MKEYFFSFCFQVFKNKVAQIITKTVKISRKMSNDVIGVEPIGLFLNGRSK